MAGALRSTAVRLLVTVAILSYLLRDIDLRQTAAAAWGIAPAWLAGALLLVVLDRALMILRWVLLLRPVGVALPFGAAVRIFLVSSFVGSFLPAGVGADVSRAYAVTALTAQRAQAVASVAIDRLLGLAAIVTLGAFGLAGWAHRLPDGTKWQVFAASGALLALGGAVFWVDRALALIPARAMESTWGRRAAKVGASVASYRQQPGILALVFGLSVVVQATRVLQGYTLGRGLGMAVGLAYYLVFMPVGLLTMLLPISVSGFGLPQGVMVWMLEPVGVPRADAFALSTLIVLLGLVGNLPGAFLYLGRKKPLT